ncbi:MAG: hypothetical protein V4757_14195 [Pseudomonadota bacterium]
MDEARYRTLIADFCSQVGIAEPDEVIRSNHIEVGSTTVGLMPGTDVPDGDWLAVYIDLGPVFPNRDPGIHERLLRANLEPRGDLAGSFGLHPATGNAVYHLPVAMPVTGAALAGRLAGALEQIGARFEAMNA